MIFSYVALWFISLSFLSIILMFLDKRAAIRREWRISESTLLLFAFLGGGIGAKLAQGRFCHKTRKEPFRSLLNMALVFNLVLLVVLCVPSLRDALLTFLLEIV